jgi:hypothetical protein
MYVYETVKKRRVKIYWSIHVQTCLFHFSAWMEESIFLLLKRTRLLVALLIFTALTLYKLTILGFAPGLQNAVQ